MATGTATNCVLEGVCTYAQINLTFYNARCDLVWFISSAVAQEMARSKKAAAKGNQQIFGSVVERRGIRR